MDNVDPTLIPSFPTLPTHPPPTTSTLHRTLITTFPWGCDQLTEPHKPNPTHSHYWVIDIEPINLGLSIKYGILTLPPDHYTKLYKLFNNNYEIYFLIGIGNTLMALSQAQQFLPTKTFKYWLATGRPQAGIIKIKYQQLGQAEYGMEDVRQWLKAGRRGKIDVLDRLDYTEFRISVIMEADRYEEEIRMNLEGLEDEEQVKEYWQGGLRRLKEEIDQDGEKGEWGNRKERRDWRGE